MRNIARKEIFKINPYVPGKPIEEVKRELGLRDVIKLASNENPLPPSREALRAAQKALRSANRYPDGGCFYLKNALAASLGVKPDNLIIGNGSDELIILALRAFVKKGDEVIIAKPTFLIYEIASKISGAKIKFVPVKDFRYDIPKMASLITKKTKLVFVANPDNPLGTYVTKKEIELLVKRAPKSAVLFFDEAYYEFARMRKDYPRTLKYLKAKGKSVIIARTFSKIYSLAGLRVGYAIAKEEIIDCLNRACEPFNVNSIAQAAAMAALRDKGHVSKSLKLIEKGKSYICSELDLLGIKYIPSVTNFVVINIGKDAKKVYKKLMSRGVIVRGMRAWKLNNFIRVTVGTMSENRRFIRVLKEVL
ncbi:histidinol-phosphate transaminase [Candidatus Omnitrophota bacterium]